MSYAVKLPVFEGPLDLLLHLIEKNELDIYDIPMATVTGQYLDYLATMRQMDLEVTSEFLVMASTLLAIKARMLLPKPKQEDLAEDGPDPRQELVARLLEYKRFKEVAAFLQKCQQEQGRVYTRPNTVELYQDLFRPLTPLQGVSMEALAGALSKVIKRAGIRSIPEEITREELRVPDKMREVLCRLVLYPKGLPFSKIFAVGSSRGEIVVTFLAVLELLRLGQVTAEQPGLFEEIILYHRPAGQEE